jgi:hypothetical protein
MPTPFSFSADLSTLFADADLDHPMCHRMSLRVSGDTDDERTYQVMFDGRRIPGQATSRTVLTVYASRHPTAKRLLPKAKSEYVVMYDTPKRDDVAEEVRSCEQLGHLAMTYCVMPDQETLAGDRFADKHLR